MSEADKYDRLAAEMSGRAGARRMAVVGKVGALEVERAVRADIGDDSMSHWRRGAPIPITGTAKVLGPTTVEVAPQRRAAGPMRVLESGRQAYAAGDRRVSGTYTSKKTGERRTKTRKVKHATGATDGKNTWTHAVERMVPTMSDAYHSEFVVDVTRNIRSLI